MTPDNRVKEWIRRLGIESSRLTMGQVKLLCGAAYREGVRDALEVVPDLDDAQRIEVYRRLIVGTQDN